MRLFAKSEIVPDYKEPESCAGNISDEEKFFPEEDTGFLCCPSKAVGREIKKARYMAFIPSSLEFKS